MVPIEQTVVSVPMAMLLGLAFGMGGCTLACLPYLGPVFLASDGGPRRAWRILLPFSLGRMASYLSLAGAAGAAGQYLGEEIGGGWLRVALGVAAVAVGLALVLRRPAPLVCGRSGEAPLGGPGAVQATRVLMPGGLFLMGAAMALTPCVPFATVLFSAATAGNLSHGIWLGLGFGAGAIVVPTLVYGIGIAYLGSRLRERLRAHRRAIDWLGSAMLVLTGAGAVFA